MSENSPQICSHCGAPLIPGERFCPQCGKPISAIPPLPDRPKSSKRWVWATALLGFVLLLLLIAIAATLLRPPPQVQTPQVADQAASLGVAVPNASPTPTATLAQATPSVAPLPSETPTQTADVGDISTPAPTPTSTPTLEPPITTCTNAAAFVADVTIADGTVMTPGQSFVKTWRLSNSGTCAWDSSYQFVFVDGNQMGGASPQPVPSLSSGGTVDESVSMQAPAAPGTYKGRWQMRAPDGVMFGSLVTVIIVVPGPNPTPTKTVPPPAACSGTPSIASFTASPSTITAGSPATLQWGQVTNATSASIDPGIGGVQTPGSTVVSPASTTTYILTATCGPSGGTTTASVTVTVIPPIPVQVSPGNGAVLTNFPRNATFDWNGVSFPGGVTYGIEIQINTGTWQNFKTQTGLSGTNYAMTNFSGDNQGRWRVWATSPTAGDGPRSGWWGFSFKTATTHKTGPLDIQQTYMADLDEGNITTVGADIWFEAQDATHRYVTPQNGATIAKFGTTAPSKYDCMSAALSGARININNLPVGTYVCLKTNQGRYSEFRVNAAVGPSPGVLHIGYTTWD